MTAPGSRRKARRPRRGALFVIAALLAASGVLRVGLGASHALAEASVPEAALTAPEQVCKPDGGAMAMLEDLKTREERLARREAEIADQSQAITVAKAEIEERLTELVAAEKRLARTLTLADEAAGEDVARLVAVYEKMKPKDAASLFGEMDADFAAGFLARMEPEAAAAVMAGLEPKDAYTISVVLAGRNAAAPKE